MRRNGALQPYPRPKHSGAETARTIGIVAAVLQVLCVAYLFGAIAAGVDIVIVTIYLVILYGELH